MRRRDAIAALAAVLMASRVPTLAQAKVFRVGVLTAASSAAPPSPINALRAGLADLGYVEGRNIALDFRFARGDYGAFPRLAAELVDLPVDIIVVDGGAAAGPAIAATKVIPIVIATAGDPVRLGFVTSLARPGGNVTGFSLVSTELNLKRLELLQLAVPEAREVAVLFNPVNPTAVDGMQVVAAAGRRMGLSITPIEAQTPEALRTLAFGSRAQVPVLVVPDAMFWNQRHAMLAGLNEARRPALYPEREYADDGGLIAYGPTVPDNFRRAAGYVDRILKGANPGDLPIQQPAKFDFVINIKTARSLGLTLPPNFLARADEVIE